MKQYYTIPFDSESFINKGVVKKNNLKQSISTHIHLINITHFGECSFDEKFGCAIWDVDFDNLSSSNKIKEVVMSSLLESLKVYEKRLSKISVSVDIKQEELTSRFENTIVKKKVSITIKGKVKKTNENFAYSEYFYIGPLSY